MYSRDTGRGNSREGGGGRAVVRTAVVRTKPGPVSSSPPLPGRRAAARRVRRVPQNVRARGALSVVQPVLLVGGLQ